MELLGGWIVVAIITAVVAKSRGRSAFGWFLLGCLISVFALILVALLPSLKPAEAAISRYPPGTLVKDCPDCGEEVLAVAKVCKHCGYRPAED